MYFAFSVPLLSQSSASAIDHPPPFHGKKEDQGNPIRHSHMFHIKKPRSHFQPTIPPPSISMDDSYNSIPATPSISPLDEFIKSKTVRRKAALMLQTPILAYRENDARTMHERRIRVSKCYTAEMASARNSCPSSANLVRLSTPCPSPNSPKSCRT